MDNYISWNLPNWITIVLMGAVFFAAYGILQSGLKSATGQS